MDFLFLEKQFAVGFIEASQRVVAHVPSFRSPPDIRLRQEIDIVPADLGRHPGFQMKPLKLRRLRQKHGLRNLAEKERRVRLAHLVQDDRSDSLVASSLLCEKVSDFLRRDRFVAASDDRSFLPGRCSMSYEKNRAQRKEEKECSETHDASPLSFGFLATPFGNLRQDRPIPVPLP